MNIADKLDHGETMDEMWQGFHGMVMADVPPGAQQYIDMQGAFYAGALTLFNWLMGLDDGDDATERDLDRISAMTGELHEFFNTIEARNEV